MDYLELTYSMGGDFTSSGVDDHPDNPLARATQCLFLEGKPFKRLSKCFYLDTAGQLRWMGIFVHSAGDRIIFFPGLSELQQHVTAYNDNTLRWDKDFRIDHLSLDPDWLSWHFTESGSTAHLGKIYTHQLAPGIFHWFSMSVSNEHDLRITRRETKVSAATPPNDIDRRVDIFTNARERAIFQILRLNQSSPSHQPCFLHFSVTIGPPGFVSTKNVIFRSPHGSPFVTGHSGNQLTDIPCRAHRIQLSDRVELEVISSVLPGSLQTRVVFGGLPSRTKQDQ